MKRQLALVPAALMIAATLTSCTTEEAPVAADCLAPGAASDAIQVEGDFGTQLALVSETPGSVETTQRTVIESGLTSSGEPIDPTQPTFTSLTVFDGTDGSLIEFSQTSLKDGGGFRAFVGQTLNCANGGDRVVIVTPKQEVFEDAEPEESIIIVSDLIQQAMGEDLDLPAGLPAVEIAENGEPSITIPKNYSAPLSLTIETMVRGEGATVEVGDQVFVHYRGVIVRTGEEFDSSWSSGAITPFPAATPEEAAAVGAQSGVIGGFRHALVGQTVGSRVMSIVPPEDGYGPEGLKQRGFQEDDVMVFVLDILGSVPAPTPAN